MQGNVGTLAAGQQLASDLGCTGTGTAAETCLRRLTPKQLVNKVGAFDTSYYIFAPWQESHNIKVGPQNKYILMPTIDGDILPDEPLKLLQRGTHNQVPLLIGSTHDEFEFFISDTDKITSCQHYDQYINAQFENKASDVAKRYPCNNDKTARDVAVQAAGDFYFTCPSRRAGRSAAAAPNAKPVYQYLYSNPVSPNPLNPPGFRNASHLADIPFVFATFFETAIILGQLPPWAIDRYHPIRWNSTGSSSRRTRITRAGGLGIRTIQPRTTSWNLDLSRFLNRKIRKAESAISGINGLRLSRRSFL